MNANELAEQLDEYAGNSGYSHNDYADSMSQAATMLRQQQAEIEELKAKLGCDPAYFDMPARKLTEEEIWVEVLKTLGKFALGREDVLTFARAILRKAGEK